MIKIKSKKLMIILSITIALILALVTYTCIFYNSKKYKITLNKEGLELFV